MKSPTPPPVDYDAIAATYDSRYRTRDLTGIRRSLLRLARRLQPAGVLEAGCGTGHWLAALQPALPTARLVGLDLSAGMLAEARRRLPPQPQPPGLVQATAAGLPFPPASFDLVYCINALHHFGDPPAFIAEARRLLAPGGALYIANMDPHRGADQWSVYHYFPGTLETDLQRYPAMQVVRGWMRRAGFTRVRTRPAEVIRRAYRGSQVFDDPILGRLGTSQLALLSDAEYAAGIERMRRDIESGGEHPPLFRTDITLWGTTGYAP